MLLNLIFLLKDNSGIPFSEKMLPPPPGPDEPPPLPIDGMLYLLLIGLLVYSFIKFQRRNLRLFFYYKIFF